MLTDGCQADSVPNLEIETGEIEGAGHASATGRFDDEQLFYLQSRGIPEEEARRLVVHGFFNDIVAQDRRAGARGAACMAAVEAELEKNVTQGVGGVGVSFTRACGAERPRGRYAVRGRPSTASTWPSCATARSSSPSATSAATPTSPLSEGDVEGCHIECWLHGSTFDLRTGKPTSPAGLRAGPGLPRTCRRRRRARRRREPPEHRRTERMSNLEIRDLHVTRRHRGRPQGDPQGRHADHQRRRDPRHHGPQRLRQVDAGLLDRRPPEVHVTCGTVTLDGDDVLAMTVDERARAGLFLAMQYPVEVPGVSVANFLRTAKTAIDGEAPKLRTWVKDVNSAMDRVQDGPGLRRSATSTRASPAVRRSATRSSSWSCSTRRSPSSTRPTPASTSTR